MCLELNNIKKTFGRTTLFDHLNLHLDKPGFYLLSGKSGSGKTTLLNIIAGFEPFEKGERKNDLRIACVFQSYELIESLTVLENVRLASDLKNQPFDEVLFERLGLKEIANHYPKELSGGQKQRVGLARALNQNPDFIILDEPTELLVMKIKILC